MAFVAKEFLEGELTQQKVDSLRKDELLNLGIYLELDVKTNFRKKKIKEMVVDCLVRQNILTDYTLQNVSSDSEQEHEITKLQLQLKMKEMEAASEIKKLELEREIRENEIKKLELQHDHETEIEIKKLELEQAHEYRMKQLENESKRVVGEQAMPVEQNSSNYFDVTKQVRLVPKFNEKEVDKFFMHFEKIAESME